MRPSGRSNNEMRPISIETDVTRHAEGSCMIRCGDTHVLCTASIDERVPPWIKNSGLGWVTAEYGMLPRATHTRSNREAKRGQSGRTQEIQRLIGRSLRACIDRPALGERQILIDCDVIQADGGTRCASITGGWVALRLAVNKLLKSGAISSDPIVDHVAAVSCGIYAGQSVLDLDYPEDSEAGVDGNFVLTGSGQLIEVQMSAEGSTFSRDQGVSLSELRSLNPGLDLARLAIGSEVRVAKASPRALLAIRPTGSGGASFPALPALPGIEGSEEGNQTFMWPTKGVFTSGFGWRWGRMHKGIDIANNVGTPIVAAKDGIVKFSGWSSGYGYLVELVHSDGSSTRYAHNSRLLVRKGQIIPQGVRISLMGSTGRSTGPHLHFEIRQRGGSALDPMAKLPSRRRA